jgi:hypothetical protein
MVPILTDHVAIDAGFSMLHVTGWFSDDTTILSAHVVSNDILIGIYPTSRVEHGYTAGRISPHRTHTRKHRTCAGYIPYRPVNHTVPYKTRGISVTRGLLITIV